MSGPALLLGAMLGFWSAEGDRLELRVFLSQPASVRVDWAGSVSTASTARVAHRLGPFSVPRGGPAEVRLFADGNPVLSSTVPDFDERPLRVAVYGDSRDGFGPHALLARRIAEWRPHAVIHTGDVVHSSVDEAGWRAFLAHALPVSSAAPYLLALGNHELAGPPGPSQGRRSALEHLPPPSDPLAERMGVPDGAHHVRLGPAVIVCLDSNSSLEADSAQLRFLEEAVADAGVRLAALHHGPLSSGPHGGHPSAAALLAVADRIHLTAYLAGHDHLYERFLRGKTTVLVSGGGGAPLYPALRIVPRSAGAVSAYHYVALEIFEDHVRLEARSLEGLLLDRAQLPPAEPVPSAGRIEGVLAAVALLLLGLAAALARVLRPV